MTVEEAIPAPLREAIFAAGDLFRLKYKQIGLVRLRWRNGRLRRVEVHELPDPVTGEDDLDVEMALGEAGFDEQGRPRSPARGFAAWVWEAFTPPAR